MFENSAKLQPGYTKAMESLYSKSQVLLGDAFVGLMDEYESFDYLHQTNGVPFWKPFGYDAYNVNHPHMLFYWNFAMLNEAKSSIRVRYHLIDVVEQVGGLLSSA